jgi:hypothetical protein
MTSFRGGCRAVEVYPRELPNFGLLALYQLVDYELQILEILAKDQILGKPALSTWLACSISLRILDPVKLRHPLASKQSVAQ